MKSIDQQIDISELGELRTVVTIDTRGDSRKVRIARPVVDPNGAKAFCDIYNRHPTEGLTAIIMRAEASIVGGRLVIRSGKLPRLKRRKAAAV